MIFGQSNHFRVVCRTSNGQSGTHEKYRSDSKFASLCTSVHKHTNTISGGSLGGDIFWPESNQIAPQPMKYHRFSLLKPYFELMYLCDAAELEVKQSI